jgi:hypothetical protein
MHFQREVSIVTRCTHGSRISMISSLVWKMKDYQKQHNTVIRSSLTFRQRPIRQERNLISSRNGTAMPNMVSLKLIWTVKPSTLLREQHLFKILLQETTLN